MIDFMRKKDGIPARVAAIEYDPNRSARIALLHYVDGEKDVHPGSGWPQGGRSSRKWSGSAADGGQRDAAEEHSAGYGRAQRRAAAQSRSVDVSQRRDVGHAGRSRSRVGSAQLAQRRNSSCAVHLPSDDWQGWQRRTHGNSFGESRPQTLARSSSARSRHGDEPGRSPARWW